MAPEHEPQPDTAQSLTLEELQRALAEFEGESWDAATDEESYTRHIALHIMKLAGKIGTVCERREHGLEPELSQLREEVIPDLLYYALGLAAKHKVDLPEAFLNRLDANRERVAGWVARRDVDSDRRVE